MTEADWLACDDPAQMLEFLKGEVSDRKLRLFACGCARRYCRIYDHSAPDDYFRRLKPVVDAECAEIITVVEADEKGTEAEICRRRIHELETPIGLKWGLTAAVSGDAGYWARYTPRVPPSAREQGMLDANDLQERCQEQQFLLHLLRDIFGNPFRPVAFAPEWRTDTAVMLARRMYESREFGAMPILADALQDAGCNSDDILTHCRDPHAAHVRGCWVCDLVLRKA